MTIEDEQAALRAQLIEDAEADFTKNLDARDPDADFMRSFAKDMAVDIVDAVLADAARRREAAAAARAAAPPATPAMFAHAIRELLEKHASEELHDELAVDSAFDPATKTIRTVIVDRTAIVLRQVGDGPEDER